VSQEASVAKVSQSDGSATIVQLNPSTRPRKGWEEDKRNIKSSLGQLAVYRDLSRFWRSNLSSPELSVLLYLIDQTVGIGVETRTLTVRGMNRGADKATGLGMSGTQLRAHLHNLETKGFILVNPDKSTGFTITVNRDWTPETMRNEAAEEGADMLSTPKRLQNELSSRVENEEEGWGTPAGKSSDPLPENRRTPIGKPADPLSENRHPLKEPTLRTYSMNLSEGSCGSADADRDGWESFSETEETSSPQKTTSIPLGSVRKRIRPSAKNSERDVPAENFEPGSTDPLFEEDRAPVRARSRPTAEQLAAERARKAEARRGRSNPGAVAETFAEAFGLALSEIEGMRPHSLTKVELGKLKQGLCKDWAGEPEQLHAFVEYCVANWTQIVAECFKWMTKKPAPIAPDLLFLNWQRKEFIDAWNHRARSSWLDKIENVDRRRYNTLTKVRGMPHDAAVLQIAKEKAAREIREETDAKLAEANRRMRTAQIMEKRAVPALIPEGKSHKDKELARLREENARLRRMGELQRAAAKDGDILQPGANFEMPEWKDD
jgi:hypothetical protein